MSPYLAEFLSLALIHFLAVVAPGPDFAVTIRQSVRYGRAVGLYTAIGIGAGISVHVLYTLMGIGALMHTLPWLLGIAKVVGGTYILYLAVMLLRSKPATDRRGAVAGPQHDTQGASTAFRIGFLTNATNPKATLFFLAMFTTVVSGRTPLQIQALYGVWMCAVNAAWFMLVSALFSSGHVRQTFLRMGHWFERIMGAVLVFFALRLLFSILPRFT
ncbi:LysE family translocator [Pseudomonas sp. Marseille-QA0892]